MYSPRRAASASSAVHGGAGVTRVADLSSERLVDCFCGTVRFVLYDGVEIHRIDLPTEVYDYDTGKVVGHAGPRRRFVRSGTAPAVEAKVASPKTHQVEISTFLRCRSILRRVR